MPLLERTVFLELKFLDLEPYECGYYISKQHDYEQWLTEESDNECVGNDQRRHRDEDEAHTAGLCPRSLFSCGNSSYSATFPKVTGEYRILKQVEVLDDLTR